MSHLLEGSQSAAYYLLVMRSKDLVATPAVSWYNFNKVAQYRQLTMEEAEEKMKNRRWTADGYGRWLMKAAKKGAAAFGEVENDEKEAKRKSRIGLNKRRGGDDNDDDENDDEGHGGGDHDLDDDDDDVEKGANWEHDEIFTDDDEAVGNDPEEGEDLGPEVPAPPEINQDEEEGRLSKSGKELKELLERQDIEDEVGSFPPNQKDNPEEAPAGNNSDKPAPSGSTSKSAKDKTIIEEKGRGGSGRRLDLSIGL